MCIQIHTMSAQKPKHKHAVRTTISLPPIVYDELMKLVRDRGFGGLSDYVATRGRLDTALDKVPNVELVPR